MKRIRDHLPPAEAAPQQAPHPLSEDELARVQGGGARFQRVPWPEESPGIPLGG